MEDSSMSSTAVQTAPLSSIATAMLFGSITFCTAALATRAWLTGDNRAIIAAMNPMSRPLSISSFASLYCLLHHFTILGLILFFAYICENHPPFPHGEKVYDRDEFFFLVALVIIVSFYTVRKNDLKSTVTSSSSGGAKLNGGNGGKASLENKLQTIAESSAYQSHTKDNENGSYFNKGKGNETLDEIGGNDMTIASGSTYDRDDSTYTSYTSSASTFNTKATFIQAAPTKACDDILNRDQTEEWKGWMQFVFLLYHYYHAEEVYNSIRVMITCYVWMTGFGNFSFFYLKGDYSIVRVLQMLWRLNFLAFFLCLSQGSTYILYYICPLHTYFFLMVYFTMSIGRHLNYSKYGLRLKMGVLALIIYLVWDVDTGLFRMIHFAFLSAKPVLGATNGSLWEWYFRSTLDHWSTFLGMIFAANFPITSLFIRKVEALPPMKCWLVKGSIALALIVITTIWIIGPFRQEKFMYNATNAYFGFIPLLTYIYLRNLTPKMRSYSLHLLHEIGKTTLETYLMQHHIWLTSNAKSLLTLIPGWPKMNMLVVTFIYFYVSRRLYRLTLYLRGMLLPNDKKKCITNLFVLGSSVTAFYILAFSLHHFGLISFASVGIISIIFGVLLYQTIMDYTWESYHSALKKSKDDNSFEMSSVFTNDQLKDSSVARYSPMIIGTVVVFIVGISWQGMAKEGASKLVRLHSGCDAVVNRGHWIPIDGCNESALGAARRKYGITNFATCNSAAGGLIWGWESSPSSTHCRFVQRNEKQLLKLLRYQRVTFVGDSMTRNLFHAFCRQLGMKIDQYNTGLDKHADIVRTVEKTGIEFKWAPLASDLLKNLQVISEQIQKDGVNSDLIVSGIGAWDRLHLYATDEDQESLKLNLEGIKREFNTLQSLGVPVIWQTPTTINTPALNKPEKQDHMTENDIADMRNVFERIGILASSSFVIDGPAYSKERVAESYDGVHYPHEVYDAGAQILANALDWLVNVRDDLDQFTPPEPGKMANPFLGLMMLCLSFIGLIFFDGFFGFSYLASLFVKGVLPSDLYYEAFKTLHDRMRLPPISFSSSTSVATLNSIFSTDTTKTKSSIFTKSSSKTTSTSPLGKVAMKRHSAKDKEESSSVDEEIAALLEVNQDTETKDTK